MSAGIKRKNALKVRLAAPRGFCAGVERAIRTVEETLSRYGAPVYVRHEIVHNRHVIDRLKVMGAVFIDDLDEAAPDRPVIFSAHGAPLSAHEEAKNRNLLSIDATCPLVSKVHTQVRRHAQRGRHIILIGHKNHQEVIGTMGQAADGEVTLVETPDDVARLAPTTHKLAYVTQTTLSVDDTDEIIQALKDRFPGICGPAREDICYATSNRQSAVKTIAPGSDLFVVIGSTTSSNSVRLVETAQGAGAKKAILIDDANDFDMRLLDDVATLCLSAGASVPEPLVEGFLKRLAENRILEIETVEVAQEDITFKPPLRLAG